MAAPQDPFAHEPHTDPPYDCASYRYANQLTDDRPTRFQLPASPNGQNAVDDAK